MVANSLKNFFVVDVVVLTSYPFRYVAMPDGRVFHIVGIEINVAVLSQAEGLLAPYMFCAIMQERGEGEAAEIAAIEFAESKTGLKNAKDMNLAVGLLVYVKIGLDFIDECRKGRHG